jgi:chromosome segregation ATPase
MKSRVSFPFFLLALLLAGTTLLPAAEGEEDVANKLREALRNTMLQLRDSQNQVATLQATGVADAQKIKDLEGKVETLTKQAIADRNTSANMVAELNTKLEEQRAVLITFQSAIEKWKKSYGQVTTLAQKKEAERAKLEAKSIQLERQVEDQRIRNIKMYEVGLEIIDRYEKFGLGDAILAREPFVGSTRVKFQNLIQNDQDKLADQKIKQP